MHGEDTILKFLHSSAHIHGHVGPAVLGARVRPGTNTIQAPIQNFPVAATQSDPGPATSPAGTGKPTKQDNIWLLASGALRLRSQGHLPRRDDVPCR